MTKKQTTTILKVQSSDFLKKKKTWKYKDALIVTMLTLGGIYAVFFTLILIENSDAVINLFQAQALLGGLFVNLCAVISVAYSKFAMHYRRAASVRIGVPEIRKGVRDYAAKPLPAECIRNRPAP